MLLVGRVGGLGAGQPRAFALGGVVFDLFLVELKRVVIPGFVFIKL